MQAELFTFCDAATDYEGRLSLLGATDRFVAPYLPFRLPACAVALRMRATRSEVGEHMVHISLIDAERRTQLNVNGEVSFHLPQGAEHGMIQMVVNAQGLDFLVEGEYALVAEVNGRLVAKQPLTVTVRQDELPALAPKSAPAADGQE
jgi:hypothetical protein